MSVVVMATYPQIMFYPPYRRSRSAGLLATAEDQVVVPVRVAHLGVRVQLEELLARDA